jgi:hypothetical protein
MLFLLLYWNDFLLSGTRKSFSKVLFMHVILFPGLQSTAVDLMVTVMNLLDLLRHGLYWQKKLRWVFYFSKGHYLYLCLTLAYYAYPCVMQQQIKDIPKNHWANYDWITEAHISTQLLWQIWANKFPYLNVQVILMLHLSEIGL